MEHTYQFYKAMLAFLKTPSFSHKKAKECSDLYLGTAKRVTFTEVTFDNLEEWNRQLHHSQEEGKVDNAAHGKGLARREEFAKCAFTDLAPFFHTDPEIPKLFARIKLAAELSEDLFIYISTPPASQKGSGMVPVIYDDWKCFSEFTQKPENFFKGDGMLHFSGTGVPSRKKS